MTTGSGYQGVQITTPGAGTYNVPAGRSLVWVTMQAAGGGGNGFDTPPFGGGGGGAGGGESCFRVPYVVTPGGTVSYTVGAGGVGSAAQDGFGAPGGDTIFGTLRCQGAKAGTIALQTFKQGNPGGGANGATTPVGVAGLIGGRDAPPWWGGSGGGQDSSGSNPARVGGPAAGRLPAAANASPDRGGGPGAASIFADGVAGCNEAANGANGSLGGGGGGGGGGTGGFGGTGGDGLLIIEHV